MHTETEPEAPAERPGRGRADPAAQDAETTRHDGSNATTTDLEDGPTGDGTPRIYVACLASYNAGILHGTWMDATDADTMRDEVAAMLARSGQEVAEEYAIHDHEGFGPWGPDEYEPLDDIAAKGAFIEERGDVGAEVLAHFSGRLDEAEAAFEEYAGEWPDLGHFAEDLTEQSGTEIPDSVRLYVDYDAMGRDLELGGDVFTVRTTFDAVHVFWSR